jgi:hypothetical protein
VNAMRCLRKMMLTSKMSGGLRGAVPLSRIIRRFVCGLNDRLVEAEAEQQCSIVVSIQPQLEQQATNPSSTIVLSVCFRRFGSDEGYAAAAASASFGGTHTFPSQAPLVLQQQEPPLGSPPAFKAIATASKTTNIRNDYEHEG